MEKPAAYYPIDSGFLASRLANVAYELAQAYEDEKHSILEYQREWNSHYSLILQEGAADTTANRQAKVLAHDLWVAVEEVRTIIRILVEERDLIRTLLSLDAD